jgi:hypothetical protein
MTQYVPMLLYTSNIKLQGGTTMSKGVISTTAEIVNGIWNIGTEVYQTVSGEISESIDEEALERTRKYFNGDAVDEESAVFQKRYRIEREIVAREYKSVAIRGGMLAFGLGWFL